MDFITAGGYSPSEAISWLNNGLAETMQKTILWSSEKIHANILLVNRLFQYI